ncbi:uncharacterized protein CTRU02_213340 [Colletotrichum truncatum]|uniref:Uncharacterized protein n=1 Tax=Colletotrichum truncatum TaxID=5467 RepID=A0ACC3YMJ0_COLTU
MRVSVIFTSAIILVTANANPMRRDDPHILNFRIWSEKSCGANGQNTGNLGVWTINKSQTGQCQPTFNAPQTSPVRGIVLDGKYLAPGCHLTAYTIEGCEGTGQEVLPQACSAPPTSESSWLSFSVQCDTV